MKRIELVILTIIMLIPTLTKSSSIKVSYQSNLYLPTIQGMDMRKDSIAIFGINTDLPGFFDIPQIGVFDGKNWNKLPNLLDISDSSSYLQIAAASQVHFDSTGALWLTGRSLYKFENNKWKEFYIDDEYRDYRQFGEFTIDKNNNVWVTTVVVSNKNPISKGELYKFDGTDFKLILETKSSTSFLLIGLYGQSNFIVTLPNNKILVQRKINKLEEGRLDDMNDLYFFNQDGTYTTEWLRTPSWCFPLDTFNLDSSNKRISQIYPENENKIWFTLLTIIYYDHSIYDCCSGISLFEDGTWHPFDTSNNLKLIKAPVYEQIYKIIKLNKENYFAFGSGKIYRFSEDYKMHTIPLDNVINSSEFIVFNKDAYDDIDLKINKLIKDSTHGNEGLISVMRYKDDELWLLYYNGILIFNPLDYMSITESERNDQSNLYPNPSSGIIHIGTNISFDYYKIYNMYGAYIGKGTNKSKDINIKDFPSGLYYVQFYLNGKIIFTKNFIKVN